MMQSGIQYLIRVCGHWSVFFTNKRQNIIQQMKFDAANNHVTTTAPYNNYGDIATRYSFLLRMISSMTPKQHYKGTNITHKPKFHMQRKMQRVNTTVMKTRQADVCYYLPRGGEGGARPQKMYRQFHKFIEDNKGAQKVMCRRRGSSQFIIPWKCSHHDLATASAMSCPTLHHAVSRLFPIQNTILSTPSVLGRTFIFIHPIIS